MKRGKGDKEVNMQNTWKRKDGRTQNTEDGREKTNLRERKKWGGGAYKTVNE